MTTAEDESSVSPLTLSDEQLDVLNSVFSGRNVFITGGAGVGKTIIVQVIIEALKRILEKKEELAITASTGFAALQLDGKTLHAWGGIKLGTESVDDYTNPKKRFMSASTKKAMIATKFLIIEEASMIDADYFDKLEAVVREIRSMDKASNRERFFGGVNVIMLGDFYQLPPVSGKFIFKAECWKRSHFKMHNLTTVYRQKENNLITALNNLRVGTVTEQDESYWKSFDRELREDETEIYTRIFPKREQVKSVNDEFLSKLPGQLQPLNATDSLITTSRKSMDYFSKEAEEKLIPKLIQIKVGCRIMIVKNIDRFLVNGKQGTVTEITNTNSEIPIVKVDIDGKIFVISQQAFEIPGVGKRLQYPIVPSYAVTIHKAQGLSIQHLFVDVSGAFEIGQIYVAASRATDARTLIMKNFSSDLVKVCQEVAIFYNTNFE